MVSRPTGPALRRRTFLRAIGAGAAATAGGGVLVGCSERAGSEGSATEVDKIAGVLPDYRELPLDLPEPDVMGTPPDVPHGYTTYPSNLVDAIPDPASTGGETIKAMTPFWGPPPPGLGSNAYLEAVNDQLGVQLDFSIQDGNTYADKLNAILGARDVPDLLCVPSWEVDKIARFSDAIDALFEDLTDYLAGESVHAYPMLATFPTGAWEHSVWAGRLAAIPNPSDGPFPWALFYRQDLFDAAGLTYPTSIDELHEIGRQVTDPGNGVWAFNHIFDMVQMYYKCPGSITGWRRSADGTPEYKYETDEYRQALERMAEFYQDELIHPDILASEGADSKQLFRSGNIVMMMDGMGAWQGMQAEEQKVNPEFTMQPVPIFSATGGDPLVWGDDAPINFTFIKKGLGRERVEELLRVVNWCSAPFGTEEFQLRDLGVAGEHHRVDGSGQPTKTDLGFQEIGDQYFFISGRAPVVRPTPETPNFVPDLIAYSNAMVKHLEENPWAGIKIEWPARYSAQLVPTEDKITDILRGRRPLSDLDQIVQEWRNGGGDAAREVLATALSDAGR